MGERRGIFYRVTTTLPHQKSEAGRARGSARVMEKERKEGRERRKKAPGEKERGGKIERERTQMEAIQSKKQ